MSDLMNPTPAGASPTPPAEEPPRGSRAKTLAVVLLLGGLGLVASYYGLRRQAQAPEVAAPVPVADAGTAAPPVVEEASLPESDGRVRDLMGRMSGEPEFAKWLQEKDLVRRFTAAVNNIAEGNSPRMVLGFLAPAGGFEVAGSGDALTIDPKSYARYDTVARVFGSLDAQAAGSVYRELKSLIDQAHREIAPPGHPFDRAFSQAIQHLLAVPVPDGAVQVRPQGALYAYASPELEGLSAAQKHLLRMGPENMRTLQAKLRELQNALGLPPVAER